MTDPIECPKFQRAIVLIRTPPEFGEHFVPGTALYAEDFEDIRDSRELITLARWHWTIKDNFVIHEAEDEAK